MNKLENERGSKGRVETGMIWIFSVGEGLYISNLAHRKHIPAG